jgi:AcrR family transcriptional regulator
VTEGSLAKAAAPDLRAEILLCALEVGEALGADGLTMRNIARRLGVNQALLYDHFADKAALVAELTTIASMRLEAWLAEAVALRIDTHERLFQLCISEAEFGRCHPWLYGLAFEHARLTDGSDGAWELHPFIGRASALIAQLVPRGRDPKTTARHLCVALHGLAVAAERWAPEPTYVESYVHALLDGVPLDRETPRRASSRYGSEIRDLEPCG